MLFAGFRSTTVLVVIVAALMASLNVTVTVAAGLTAVAPLTGVRPVIVGGTVSAVVNDDVASATNAFPARSLRPVDPPRTRIVYTEELANEFRGFNVATRVAPSYVTVEATTAPPA